jgi:carbon-monoxide dehydrogenase large subunit
VYFDPPGPTFPGAVHVAVVELDRETGGVRVLKYVVVEDCGPVLNPMIVEGQVHGAALPLRAEALADARVPPT